MKKMPAIRYICIFAVSLLLFLAAKGLFALSARFPDTVERIYSRGIYPWLALIPATLSSIFPFSLAQFLIPAVALIFAVFFIREIIRIILRRDVLRILRTLAATVFLFCAFYFLFIFMWGINYNRSPLSKTLEYEQYTPKTEDMTASFAELTYKINTLADKITYEEDDLSCYPKGKNALLKSVWEGYQNLSKTHPDLYRVRGRVKPVAGGHYMGYTGISGIYICFTGEPNVNATLPHFVLAPTAAHEAAHLQGFAREDEANFIAYLALRQSSDIYLQYCSSMFMYTYLAGDVAATDPEAYSEIYGMLDLRARKEFAAYSLYLKQFESPVQDVAVMVNNAYLESQGQQGGTLTYGYVTRLFLADYVKNNGL